MEKILTAEDFLQDHLEISHFYDDKAENMVCYSDDVQKAMIEFAKLHVEAALKAAFEDAPCGSSTDIVTCEELHKAIMDSYPLKNIK